MPPGASFCSSCGDALALPTAVHDGDLEERRRVTILFADLSNFTGVAERMDPETVKGLIVRSLERLAQEVSEHGGRVDKFIGDNVMALFGAPLAHEDDPLRAVRAGLGMQSAMVAINTSLKERHGISFALRVGINTGEVLAGRVGESYTVIGDSVNVASRLQGAAEPGSVTVGEATWKATKGAFEFVGLAPLILKGKSTPVPAWRAVTERHSSPKPPRSITGTPLIGRATELADLERFLQRVIGEHQPHLVTVVGSAGLGKSRLLRELEISVASWPVADTGAPRVLQGHCPPYGPGVVYSALDEALKIDCQIADGDAPALSWAKLTGRLDELAARAPSGQRDLSASREETMRTAALLGRLLGMEVPAELESVIPRLDDQRMRESVFAAVRTWVELITREAPVVLAWEDIHWADEGMLDLIEHLAKWVRGPLLQVCLAREELLERRPGWGSARRTASTIFLDPLADEETRALLTALFATADTRLIETVAQRAEGNPLFAEELARGVGEGSASTGELPDTVESLLAARIDSLDRLERRIVAHAAVIGRSFGEAALAYFAGDEASELQRALESLLSKNIIVPHESRASVGNREFAFRHILIRDVAYTRLPKAERARRHFQVGAFLEDRAGDRSEEIAAVLAEHYGRAATLGDEVQIETDELELMRAKAIVFLEAAGDGAARFYSNEEALAHYEGAMSLAERRDEGAVMRLAEKRGDMLLRMSHTGAAIDAWEQTLDHHQRLNNLNRVAECQRKIGAALVQGGDRREAVLRYQTGINLLKDGQPSSELVRLYEDAAWLYLQTGDNMLAIYAAEKALGLAERLDQPTVVSRAHGIFGRVFGRIGDTVKARSNLEKAVELARGSDDRETVLALLALGNQLEDSESGHQESRGVYIEALELAERIRDVPAQVELHAALGRLSFYAGDWKEVKSSSDESAMLAEREGLLGRLCLPFVLRGWLCWREGEWAGSEKLFHRAHELADQGGWSEVDFLALYGLGLTLRDSGRLAESEATLLQALELSERAGLMTQSIQARAALTLVYVRSGSPEKAQEMAATIWTLAQRIDYPVAQAAALEAGAVSAEGSDALASLLAAQSAWRKLKRPLEAARCALILAERTSALDGRPAVAAFTAAAEQYERLGIGHLARRARDAARAMPPPG